MNIQSINPVTGEVLENFPEMRPDEIDRTVAAAYRTFHDWRNRSFAIVRKHMREAVDPARGQRKLCADHGP